MNYVVATIKPWNIAAFEKVQRSSDWHLITSPENLTSEKLAALCPRYIFFPHWSWKVPPEITDRYECVCFHMTDLPYGRGGSPLQNLILRGHKETVISALRMTDQLDAGPVYLKSPLNLEGRAQEIFEMSATIMSNMIDHIAAKEPQAIPQTGTSSVFARRKPNESELPKTGNISELYDFIRMLDADTYPAAFIEHGDYRIELKNAVLDNGSLHASISITPLSVHKV